MTTTRTTPTMNSNTINNNVINNNHNSNTTTTTSTTKVRKKYQRKRIPETEQEKQRLRIERQQQYEQIVMNSTVNGGMPPSIWSFENLFPKAVWDTEMIDKDLYDVTRRDERTLQQKSLKTSTTTTLQDSSSSSSSTLPVTSRSKVRTVPTSPTLGTSILRGGGAKMGVSSSSSSSSSSSYNEEQEYAQATMFDPTIIPSSPSLLIVDTDATTAADDDPLFTAEQSLSEQLASAVAETNKSGKVDIQLTKMVEDRIFGYRRNENDNSYYDTSLMGDGAVQFRDGVRLGNPLKINADRLSYLAKKEFRSNRIEEAQELYEMAIKIDPRDGRSYLGLSRCAERRRDFKLAREWLRLGIGRSVSCDHTGKPDGGANPFILQALGCLEEKAGHLAQAETLYISAVRSRPSHAAGWVALAQLRTMKFLQNAASGRVCYQAAEKELKTAGLPPSAYVYTAWASMEYKKCGDVRRARQLFKAALAVDKKCSAAWLQLGVMEAENENWEQAELCFETVLKFDQRNSRVLQAYAIMETKRPIDSSRKVIGLFERALKANPRDGGVLQPYALYVAKLGDVNAARDLLKRGTDVAKRHAPLWQAWGVLETREGNVEQARAIFQQGIWSCAQLNGGQSGGRSCARLWQAWGVLEASEGDHAAARRCFSRALDADNRNIAAMFAWVVMEEELGNLKDARHLFERFLPKFAAGTEEKKRLWRAYELLEQRCGNEIGAQDVYQRCMRDSFSVSNEEQELTDMSDTTMTPTDKAITTATVLSGGGGGGGGGDDDFVAAEKKINKRTRTSDKEVEVVRWDQGSSAMRGEIWLNDKSIEGKVPKSVMTKKKGTPSTTTTTNATTTTVPTSSAKQNRPPL
jgi:tetratricopeptide (TPR) repeat protein